MATRPAKLGSAWGSVIAGLVIAGFLAAAVCAEEDKATQPFAGRIDVTAVSVMLDVRGEEDEVPADLTHADFEVLEDGEPQTILAVEPLAGQPSGDSSELSSESDSQSAGAWQVVIFFDQKLASRRGSREAALGLAGVAETLAGLGRVQILTANDEVEELLAPTRDPEVLRGVLERAAKKNRGHEELMRIRRQFLRDFQGGATEQEQIVAISGARGGGGASAPAVDRTADGEARERMLIRSALRQEMNIVNRQSEILTRWAKRDRRLGPRLLLLVHDGFDAEPRDFYLGMASSGVESSIGSELVELSLGPVKQRLTRLLSAQGWIVMPIAVGRQQAAGLNTVEEGGAAGASNSDRLGVLRRAPSFLQGQALGPLLSLAEESGGTLLTDEASLPKELSRLNQRVRLDYQVARPPDGKIHRLEVRAKRPGLTVKMRQWVASETLEEVTIGRALRLAEGTEERGDLALASMVVIRDEKADGKKTGKSTGKRQGTLATRVDLASLAEGKKLLTAAAMRVSLVIFFTDREPFVHHQVQTEQDLSQGDEWKHTLTMSFPPAAAKVVVVVEELATGSWGGAVAPLVRRKTGAAGS